MSNRLALPLCVCLCLLALPCAAADKAEDFVHEDARVSGKQIHGFADGDDQAMVVLGEFRLELGRRVFTGRDAVIWVRDIRVGDVAGHAMEVYIEGNAKAVEPGGAVTTDRLMLLKLRQRGRVLAEGAFSGRSLADFPLYKRAVAVRKGEPRGEGRPTTAPAQEPSLAETRPAPLIVEKPAETAPRPKPAAKEVLPVAWRADRISARTEDRRRVVVANGNVYLSQGNPDSTQFLELRAQSAVLFTGKVGPDAKDSTYPLSVRPQGVATTLPGEGGRKGGVETVTGVYLEGDVVIARGERYLRGKTAYYDFTTDRAILLEPVFRTIQKQRIIPIYVRASEMRALSAREMWFKDAKVTTSDFYTPTYHIGASTAYMRDQTPYDDVGERIGEREWFAKLRNTTFNIRGAPVFWLPYSAGDITDTETPIRKIQLGYHSRFGPGVETQFYLFRLLGLVKPDGFEGRLSVNGYERGVMTGVDLKYARPNYSGYHMLHGMLDFEQEDEFGTQRKNIPAPAERGRLLMRHKHLLPRDWQLQLEMSYLCDKNFLEEFFPNEFHNGKEQETLLYVKKAQDNWAFDALAKVKINRFLEQTESAPDVGFHLVGEPLMDFATFFSEMHAGFKRYRPSSRTAGAEQSEIFARLDSRNEIQFPMHFGPLNLVPYATGRATYWGDTPAGDERFRGYGQVGFRANLHIWRVYNEAASRLWDVNRLRHVITPEVTAWLSDSTVQQDKLFPMDPDIEKYLRRQSGVAFGVRQRLQTKRGKPGSMHTVDWMRLDTTLGYYWNGADRQPADGRFFSYRPEHSIGRNHLNIDYLWNISDSTRFTSYTNIDLPTGKCRVQDLGLTVRRSPRLAYFLEMRHIKDLDSLIGTVGANYQLTRKYSVQFREQYDFQFDDGRNLQTSVTIIRKFPRWYTALTFSYNASDDDVGVFLSLWPEGIPEFRLAGFGTNLLEYEDKN